VQLPEEPQAPALDEEQEKEFERALIWLIAVPFSFPRWFHIRDEQPDLAERLRWAAWFNLAQSVLCVVLVGLALWAFIAIPPLVDHWMSLVTQ
jgi:hypothetical protein